MSLRFEDTTREISRNLELNNDKGFIQSNIELTCNIVEFANKIIVSILQNGEMDLSFDVPLPKLKEGKIPFNDDETDTYDVVLDNQVSSTQLLGGVYNMKNQVAVSQIGKLLAQYQNKNVILNMSGRLFSGTEFNPNDFTKLKFIIKLVKDTYTNDGKSSE